MILKTLQTKLKNEQHEPHNTMGDGDAATYKCKIKIISIVVMFYS